MSEAQQAAIAEAAPKQATNMSVSEYANRRRNELSAPAEVTQEESVEEGQVLDPEEGQVEQDIAEASGAETEEVLGTDTGETEEVSDESDDTTEEDPNDVPSNIDLDDLSDDDLREH